MSRSWRGGAPLGFLSRLSPPPMLQIIPAGQRLWGVTQVFRLCFYYWLQDPNSGPLLEKVDITGSSCSAGFREDLGKSGAMNKAWILSQQAWVPALTWPPLCCVTWPRLFDTLGPVFLAASRPLEPSRTCQPRAHRILRESSLAGLWPQEGGSFVQKAPSPPFTGLSTPKAHITVPLESKGSSAIRPKS